jgi:hypothetical protein
VKVLLTVFLVPNITYCVRGLSCPGFVMSRVCRVQGLSVQGLSVQGLSVQGLSVQGLSVYLFSFSCRLTLTYLT